MILLLKITGLLVILKALGLISLAWIWVFSPAILAGFVATWIVAALLSIGGANRD